MKTVLFLLVAFLFLMGCAKSKIQKVVFKCSGGSGDYTMTYTSSGNVVQGNYSTVTYMLDAGQYGYANAFDNNNAIFTMTITVDGIVTDSLSGYAVGMNYTNSQ